MKSGVQIHDPNMADAAHDNPALDKRLKAIYARKGDKAINLNLEPDQPYLRLLDRLGNPHLNLPPTIHIAGTNGKGSTLAFLQAMLESQGRRLHKLTSPHLLKFNERIVLQGTEISDAYLLTLLDDIESVIDDLPVTFFEYTTALAFLAFSQIEADYLLLETGMGGRFDATNVIESPILTLISNIGFDHTEFLGTTLQKIAGEKAGILKADTPCIIGSQDHEDVYAYIPYTQKAPTRYPDNWPSPSLLGDHQKNNALLATAAARHLGIDEIAIKKGLSSAHWPGRFELMGHKNTRPVYYDGGHNPQGAQTIAQQIHTWNQQGKRVHTIIGIGANKDAEGFILALAQTTSKITIVDLPDAICPTSAEQIYAKLPADLQARVLTQSTLKSAINTVTADTLVVCGSLYLYKALKEVSYDAV